MPDKQVGSIMPLIKAMAQKLTPHSLKYDYL